MSEPTQADRAGMLGVLSMPRENSYLSSLFLSSLESFAVRFEHPLR